MGHFLPGERVGTERGLRRATTPAHQMCLHAGVDPQHDYTANQHHKEPTPTQNSTGKQTIVGGGGGAQMHKITQPSGTIKEEQIRAPPQLQ